MFLHGVLHGVALATSLGSHPNIAKVLAVDSSLPTMAILMQLAYCDMVTVIESRNVSMIHKIG